MARRGHACRCCGGGCDTACPRDHVRAVRYGDDYDPVHTPYDGNPDPGFYHHAECAWTILQGTATEYLWRQTPRNQPRLAELGLVDDTLKPLTSRQALAVIRAAMAAQNWTTAEQTAYLQRLFQADPAFAEAAPTRNLEAAAVPFRAVRASQNVSGALFEFRPYPSLHTPYRLDAVYGCSSADGTNPAYTVRFERFAETLPDEQRASLIAQGAPGQTPLQIRYRLTLLGAGGNEIESAVLPIIPGHAQAVLTPITGDYLFNGFFDYLRVAFRPDDEEMHVSAQIVSSGETFSFGDNVELSQTITANVGVKHFFAPVALAEDRGGRAVASNVPAKFIVGHLTNDGTALSEYPLTAAEECDPAPNSENYTTPHRQTTVCQRRVRRGHMPYAETGRDFSGLTITLGSENLNRRQVETDLLRGVYELANVDSNDDPLANGTYWLATAPNTTFTYPPSAGIGLANHTYRLDFLEIAAAIRIDPYHACPANAVSLDGWTGSIAAAVRARFTDLTASSTYNGVLGFRVQINNSPITNPFLPQQRRVRDFLRGQPIYTGATDSGTQTAFGPFYAGQNTFGGPLLWTVSIGYITLQLVP